MAKRKRPEAKTPAAKTGTTGRTSKGATTGRTRKGATSGRTGQGATTGRTRKGATTAAPETATAPKSTVRKKASAAPTPFDPEYERPISELPPLVFPNSEQYEFRVKAEERRRSRLRNETVFAAVLGVIGVIVLVAAHTPGFLGLAAIAVVAMAAYELMVSGLE